MSEKLFEGQHDDEEVLFDFRQHPIVMRKGLLALLIFLLISMIPTAIWPEKLWLLWFVLVGLVLGMIAMFHSWISWYFSIFIVTDQRFIKIKQVGLFKRSVVDLGLGKILSINYQIEGIQQTALGFGTIIMQTYVGDLVLNNIYHPAKTHAKLVKVIKDCGYDLKTPETDSGV